MNRLKRETSLEDVIRSKQRQNSASRSVFLIIGTLRSNDATATRTSRKKWICVLSVFIGIIPTHFVNCRRTLLKLNFKGPNSSSEREITFRRCLFMSSIKRKIRHFHVVVVQKRERNVQKSVMHVRSCCFANKTNCFFDVLVVVRVVGS